MGGNATVHGASAQLGAPPLDGVGGFDDGNGKTNSLCFIATRP
jgi:hypothetical protein